jgi:hypothetical protein
MDVKIEGVEGKLGSNGILLRISRPNGGRAIGRLHVGKATLRWYRGTASVNYKQVSMDKFIEWLDSQ